MCGGGNAVCWLVLIVYRKMLFDTHQELDPRQLRPRASPALGDIPARVGLLVGMLLLLLSYHPILFRPVMYSNSVRYIRAVGGSQLGLLGELLGHKG